MESTMEPRVPIIINAGKVRKKQINALRRGQGRLVAEVADAVDQVRRSLGAEASGKQFIPVVLVYRRRGSKRNSRALRGACL